jgi:serine/threonine protein phosphatase PrpC
VIIRAAAAHTDPGRKRRRNEDNYVCAPPLFAVTDGMGGAQAGELASALAAEALREGAARGFGDARAEELVQEANRRVFERASSDASASGMGTTATVALVDERSGRVIFGHVGDSRAYLIRDGSLEQLTDDHSLVAELVRSGRLSPKEAETHPQRSVITRVLGTDQNVDVDTFAIDGRPGDVFLICSDGLSTMVGDATILDVAERFRGDLDEAVRALLAEANRGGGEDNITVVMFELGGEPETDERTRETVVGAAVGEDAEHDAADEDTLSPLDGVRAEDVATAVEAQGGGEDTGEGATEGAGEGRAPGDTIVVSVEELDGVAPTQDRTASGPRPTEPEHAEPERAEAEGRESDLEPVKVPLWRRLLALVVIAVLLALIVVLVVWGLAR